MDAPKEDIVKAIVTLRARFEKINIFILAEKSTAEELPTEVLEASNGFLFG